MSFVTFVQNKYKHYLFIAAVFIVCVFGASLNFAISLFGFLNGDIWVGILSMFGCWILTILAFVALTINDKV